MRILHTSDWHLGRTLEGFSRQQEQVAFASELCQIATQERVDMVIIAGDVFDSFNPPVYAQKLYYDTLKKLTDSRIGVIVISGNHDSPQGLCCAGSIAEKSGVIMCENPDSIIKTGVYGNIFTVTESGEGWFKLKHYKGEKLTVAALPYPSESRIAKATTYVEGESNIKDNYNETLKKLMKDVTSHFERDSANVLISHLYINGGKTSDSERNFQLGGAYAVNGDTIPSTCDYVALGHLHKPQKIAECEAPVYYSGSPIGYSFSEAGYVKSVYIANIVNHKAEVKSVPVKSGRTLISAEFSSTADAVTWCRDHGNEHILAELLITTAMPITTQQLKLMREYCPYIAAIRPQIVSEETKTQTYENRKKKSVEDSFSDFYKLKTGADIPENIKTAFAQLRGDSK